MSEGKFETGGPSGANGVTWIAAYPKSGNTWARFMVCNLLFGRQESAAALATLVPDIHEGRQATQCPEGGALLKTHFPFSGSVPFADRTVAAIYIIRHPADVLVSNFFYSQRSAGNSDPSTADFDRYVEMFLEYRGDKRWIELGMGSWEQNVRSWLQEPLPFPVVRIRYEDMIHDPQGACRVMARLLRPQSSAADIEGAVQNSSFNRMRDIERADIRGKRIGIFYKPYLQASIDSGNRFMRRGVAGDGVARLNPQQRARLLDVFGALLQEMGYADTVAA
jgi:hypothetical protein